MLKKPSETLKEKVLNYLQTNCLGRDRAITGNELTDILEIKDRRILRAAIHALREAGEPILSVSVNPGGYFIPQNLSEANDAIEELIGRTIELRKVCKGIKQGLEKRFPGSQIKLDISA